MTVLAVVPWGEGFAAALERVDAASGSAQGTLAWFGSRGEPRSMPPNGAARPMAGSVGSLDLAEAALPVLAPADRTLLGALRAEVRDQVLAVVASSRSVAVLDTVRDSFNGRGQRLLRARIGRGRRDAPESLDMSSLRLGPGRAVSGLALHGGWLHVFIVDPVRGFEVWRASATADAPEFEPTLTEGAHRFALNAMVSAVAAHPEGLLLGTAALAPASEELGSWGPELILLRSDGSWDLVWGQSRPTPDGLKRPLSGLLPGPGDPTHTAVKAIATAGAGVCVLVQDFSGETVGDRHAARPDLFDYAGEARLWRAPGLQVWEAPPLRWPRRLGAATALGLVSGGVLVGHEGLWGELPPVTVVRTG